MYSCIRGSFYELPFGFLLHKDNDPDPLEVIKKEEPLGKSANLMEYLVFIPSTVALGLFLIILVF